ncbi:hypothetical protein ABT086_19830 [Streptomyces mirabilis]
MEDVGFRQRLADLRRPWQSGHALLVIPVVLIVVITMVDILVPADRPGPLQVACLYLAAEDEDQIGGDLYAATRTEDGQAR